MKNIIHKMMFSVHRSELAFDETVETLTESAKKHGWNIPMTYDLQKGYQEAGHENMTKVRIIYFCDPDGGYRILQDDENKLMSVMMPMSVSVYETNAGEVQVAGFNLERMSMIFGGEVKEILRQGAANYAKTLEDFAKQEEAKRELQFDGGRCCLGCVSITAIVGLIIGILGLIASKILPIIMPKMMAKMMPKMMESMEKAGVQPPCAHIILEKLETQDLE